MNIIPFPTPPPPPDSRFFLDTDFDSNWYVIPAAKRAHWQSWLKANEDIYRPVLPPYVRQVGDDISAITFAGDFTVGKRASK